MDQEKEKNFKVTDKRSTFKEESSETSKEEPKQTTEPKQPEEHRQVQNEQPTEESSSIPLPEANLMTLIFSLYTHIQINLGLIPDPITQKPQKELPQAKYNIDLLGVLKEKTQGNLTKDEEQALEQVLYEARMAYVHASES